MSVARHTMLPPASVSDYDASDYDADERRLAAERGWERYRSDAERWTCCGAPVLWEHGRMQACACDRGEEHDCPLCGEPVEGNPHGLGLCGNCACAEEGACDVVEDEVCPRCGWGGA